MENQTDAARDVLAERQRQVTAEGWTPEHDDGHDDGAIPHAAACYALMAGGDVRRQCDAIWPKGWGELKAKPHRRMLVIAAALLLAEIERLDRAAAKPKWQICSACTNPVYCREHLRGCDNDEISR